MSEQQDEARGPVPTGGIAACPVCHGALGIGPRELWCANGPRYDRAREGYVNLLRPGKIRKARSGDDQQMVADRRSFLDRGHYAALADGLADLIADLAPRTLLDVGCGEGSFTVGMTAPERTSLAFDISKPAVRLAARRCPDALCAVASVHEMPVLDHSVNAIVSVMSPVHEAEFARAAAPGGHVVVVTPGSSHLQNLRRVLYRDYRPHDEQVPLAGVLPLADTRRFTADVHLASSREIHEVWGMTPYRWNAPREGQERLAALTELDVSVHFVATVYAVPATGWPA